MVNYSYDLYEYVLHEVKKEIVTTNMGLAKTVDPNIIQA